MSNNNVTSLYTAPQDASYISMKWHTAQECIKWKYHVCSFPDK